MSRRPYRRRANRRPVNHQLDAWLLAQEISRQELADRMRFTYEYISMVLGGRRTVTDGFLGRFVRTFGWDAARTALDDEETSAAKEDAPATEQTSRQLRLPGV